MGGFGDCVDDPMRRIGDRNTDQFGVQGAHGPGEQTYAQAVGGQ